MEEKTPTWNTFIWNEPGTNSCGWRVRHAVMWPVAFAVCSWRIVASSFIDYYRVKHKSVGLFSSTVNWTCWFQDTKSKNKTINTDECQLQKQPFFSVFLQTRLLISDHLSDWSITAAQHAATSLQLVTFWKDFFVIFPPFLQPEPATSCWTFSARQPEAFWEMQAIYAPVTPNSQQAASVKTGCDHLLISFLFL